MTRPPLAVSLYLLNGAILLTLEIDSAYWKEWQLFGMGGGIQLFLAINFPMALAILVGLDQLDRGKRAGHVFSLVLAAPLPQQPQVVQTQPARVNGHPQCRVHVHREQCSHILYRGNPSGGRKFERCCRAQATEPVQVGAL